MFGNPELGAMQHDPCVRREHRDFMIEVQQHWKPDEIGPKGIFISIGYSARWQRHASGSPLLQAKVYFPEQEDAFKYAERQIDSPKNPLNINIMGDNVTTQFVGIRETACQELVMRRVLAFLEKNPQELNHGLQVPFDPTDDCPQFSARLWNGILRLERLEKVGRVNEILRVNV